MTTVSSKLTDECWISANFTRPMTRAQVGALLDVLEANASTAPERAGSDERRLKAYARAQALAKAPTKAGGEWYLALERRSPLAFEASIASSATTNLRMRFRNDGRKAVFELGEQLARILEPRLLCVAPEFERRDPAEGEDAETIDWIIESTYATEPNLSKHGLIGLAPRTYFGPEIVALIGRERIDALELPKRWSGESVCIDLVPEPWNARVEDLIAPWRAAMSKLRASEVFSTGRVLSPHGTVLPRRGRRWP